MLICYVMTTNYLKYKASPEVIDIIRDEGLKPERVKVFAGPAGGPKWFISVGIDNAIMKSGFLEHGDGRVLLAGSSAGAWRCVAMACANPVEAYEKLRIAYSRNTFDASDTPVTVGAALRSNVEAFIGDADIHHIINHPKFDLAIHTVRSKGPAASANKHVEGVALIAAAGLNAISSSGMGLFYERTVFYAGSPEPAFIKDFQGATVRITEANLKSAALATGCLPYIVSGVTGIPGAPSGVYRDGGITDYQLNQDYKPGDGVTLFFHYQERIVPGWFDKKLSGRKPSEACLARVLQVYPSQDFVKLLPNSRIPDRTDFTTYVDNPAERIRIWDEASRISGVLGEQFMDDIESGRIKDLVRPFSAPNS
jgi:hypothetical protein